MFGGSGSGKSHGSFRKSIYKQLTRPNAGNNNHSNNDNNSNTASSSCSSHSSSIERQKMIATVRHRPPALTFNSPMAQQQHVMAMTNIADTNHNALAKFSPATLTDPNGASPLSTVAASGGANSTMVISPLLPPIYPTATKTHSAPAEPTGSVPFSSVGRPRCVSAWSYYQQPFHPTSSAFANTPLLENNTLVVDVNHQQQQQQQHSADAEQQSAGGSLSSRSFGQDGTTTRRLMGHESFEQLLQQQHQQQQAHHRSISASPHCATASATTSTINSCTSDTNSTAPLLIPLGNRAHRCYSGTWAPKSARVTHQHRTPPSGTPGGGRSANIYLATRHDHPTLFDFEDWHTSLDKQSQEAVYSLFMKAHKCYDIIPTSSKLVVFDTELPVSKAFFALVYNGVRAAPLFDSKSQEFVGMLTITDFIQILNKYYNDRIGDGIKQLEEHKISTWREIFQEDSSVKPFITIDPLESLHKAVQLLCEHKIHRLPVLEHSTGNILYILTHKRLIKFLYLYINDLPRPLFMDKTPKELGIGSWGDVCTISKDTPLIEAMKIFLNKRVSALPLLDSDGRVVDIYAKFDAINLAADKTYDKLDVTVYEALQQRCEWFEGVRKCSEKDSLMTVIDVIVKAEVHRLVVVDDENRVVGIISLSDILSHLVLDLPSNNSGTEMTPPIHMLTSPSLSLSTSGQQQQTPAVDEAAKEMMDFRLGGPDHH